MASEIPKSRFLIKRKDTDTAVDDIVLESEGLTIGRLVSNDLVLNHRAVSRTHAGIKDISGEFWLFNLSQSNGTILNGELVEKTALADGDVVQIGPYLIQVNYIQNALALSVERALNANTDWEAGAVPPSPTPGAEEGVSTIIMKIPPKPGTRTQTPGGSRRVEGTGLLRAAMPAEDEQALELFWKNRKREAGKIAERTFLHPRGGQKLGKFQFNWRPNHDLARLWRKSYFYAGAAAVALFSIAAYVVYESAYSPGTVSAAHNAFFTPEKLAVRNIAARPNDNTCSNCHGVTAGMQDKCIDCHRTQATPTAAAFVPTIYDAHDREGIACSSCHTEHQGTDIHLGLVRYQLCASCHNGAYRIKAGERAGSLLPVPHGGTVGYPVVYGKWEWKLTLDQIRRKGYPDAWASYEPRDQFHAVHQLGRMVGKTSCGDCHTKGVRGDEAFRTSPKGECAKCHGVSFTAPTAATAQVNCNTCHVQHGQQNDLASVVSSEGKDPRKLKDYIASLDSGQSPDQQRLATTKVFSGTGTADVLRQNKSGLSLAGLSSFGAVPWYIWAGLAGLVPVAALAVMAYGTARRRSDLRAAAAAVKPAPEPQPRSGSLDLEKLKAEGPPYPHPVVDPVLCIGCHACVEACPHDVLAIVNGISTAIALDQCMEDTGCTVECPTSPKACIVINGTKPVARRKVPSRDQKLRTNVEGIYMIGDVSGVPLIKNAINEGGQVIDFVMEDLKKEGANPGAEYDVAIIGVGPAGLSAAVIAKQRGLRYVALEQDQIVATIANYPAGKYVFFKPDTVDAKGGIPLPGVGDKKESMLAGWTNAMMSNGVVINEEESCKDIKHADGLFVVTTEKGKQKTPATYKAQRVILAIGNRGTPQKLRVPGEEIRITVPEETMLARHCPKCGQARVGSQQFCVQCGTHLPAKVRPAAEDMKVKYKLSDPDDYKGKKCIIVGAGNSAIEAAVDLTGFKRDGDKITFTRDNEVTLIVRSDLKGDLKLGNKMNLYDCVDAGKIKMLMRRAIKEIKPGEVTLMDSRSSEDKERLANDYIFALIGGEKPTKFLEGMGIKIG